MDDIPSNSHKIYRGSFYWDKEMQFPDATVRMDMRSRKTMDLRNVYGKTTNLLGDIIIILQMYLITPKCIITI